MECKKQMSWLIAAGMSILLALFLSLPLTVSAAEATPDQVHVIIENTTYAQADGAAWDGTLLEKDVPLTEGMTAMAAVQAAAESEEEACPIVLNETNSYITGIKGLEVKAGGEQSGWMGTVNDCFGNDALNETLVKAGDEIRIMYSMAWGSDLRIRVIVENTTFSQDAGAPWDGEKVNLGVRAVENLTALDAVKQAAAFTDTELKTENDSYITAVAGLEQLVGGAQSGWMGTVNNCFENVGLNETPVKAGDEIRIMHTMAGGNDLRINVIVENTTFSQDAGAPWDGEKVNLGVRAVENLTALDAVKQAAAFTDTELKIENDSYITAVAGLEQLAGGAQSGWMGTVNDCFGNIGLNETLVKAGDEIRIMHTMAWGNDLRINVIVANNTFSQDAGAPWDGEKINLGVRAVKNLTALDAVKQAAAFTDTEIEIENDSYITSIAGLSQTAGGERSGWKGRVNGTFGEVGLNETAVKAGDEICMLYTVNGGDDVELKEQTITNQYTDVETRIVGQKLTQSVTGAMTAVTYSSSDPEVAAVDASGVITCKGVGTATITSTAAASTEYKEASAEMTVVVNPETVKVKSLKSKKAKQVTVQSDGTAKDYCDGYRIQYRQKKSGKGKTITVKNTNKKALNTVIKKLKSGKLCQVRICAYKRVDGQTYVGKYSAWKTLKKVK